MLSRWVGCWGNFCCFSFLGAWEKMDFSFRSPVSTSHSHVDFPQDLKFLSFLGSSNSVCFSFLCQTAILLTLYLEDPFFTYLASKWSANILHSHHTVIHLLNSFSCSTYESAPCLLWAICSLTVLQLNGFLFSTSNLPSSLPPWSHTTAVPPSWGALPLHCLQGWLLFISVCLLRKGISDSPVQAILSLALQVGYLLWLFTFG